jgi:trimethylamine--corrinoid protein Co-methyltransferase
MIHGRLQALTPDECDRLHAGALAILQRTGLQIQGKFLLEVLADAGCQVDFAAHRVWFKPELVERQIAAQRGRYQMVRSSLWYPFCRQLPEDAPAIPREFLVDYGYTTPWVFDYPQRRYRRPSVDDQIAAIQLGNALECVAAINAPYICADFDPRIEGIESARLLLLHTDKPGWVSTNSGRDVKYLAEMGNLVTKRDAAGQQGGVPFFAAAYCTTSPLKIDARSCDVLEAALRYSFPVNFAPMPILGATAPVTPAGSVIVATAEILGCMTAATLIRPDLFYYSTSISAEMDMRTTQVCFATPAAMLTDVALHQLFREKYGLVHNIEPAYIEAKTPGMQAILLKVYRQMAFGSTVSLPLAIGVLDNGAVFSPTQAMIDLEINEGLHKFYRGMEVTDETMCLDLIAEIEFGAKQTYLATEHTARHFREIGWRPRLFDRSYCDHNAPATVSDDGILEAADRRWRELVAGQKTPERDPALVKEIDRIVAAAKSELLSCPRGMNAE